MKEPESFECPICGETWYYYPPKEKNAVETEITWFCCNKKFKVTKMIDKNVLREQKLDRVLNEKD